MFVFVLFLGLVMVWLAQRAAAGLAEACGPARRRWSAVEGRSTVRLVLGHLLLVLSDPSPQANRVQALVAQGWRLRPWRSNLMQACFADFGLWLAFGLALVFANVGGPLVFAAAGAALVVGGFVPPRGRALAGAVVSVALFAALGGLLQRMGLGAGGETGLIEQWLADGRPLTLLGLVAAMAVLAALSGWEFSALVLALIGLSSGALSLNGAVVLLWGERLGLGLRLVWQSRGQIPSVRRLAAVSAGAQAVGLPVALLLLGYARDGLAVMPGRENLPFLMESFVLLSFLTAGPAVIAAAVFGHFDAKRTPDDALQRRPLSAAWLASVAVRTSSLEGLREDLATRQRDLSRLRAGFSDAEWGKVPPGVRQASEAEAAHVAAAAGQVEAVLLSRWDFFGHQLR